MGEATRLVLPLGPGLARWDAERFRPGWRSETLGGKRHFRSRAHAAWRVSLAWAPLRRDEADEILAFVLDVAEGVGFWIRRPDHPAAPQWLHCEWDGPQGPWSYTRGGLVRIELSVVETPAEGEPPG